MLILLRTLVLAALTYLHPGAPGAEPIANAIAGVVSETCQEPGALGSCELDAIALGVLAESEGRLCLGASCARGDQGRSVSTFQVMARTPREVDLWERDLLAATRRAYDVLRWGAQSCPAEPLAPYCGGCTRRGARALARPRLAMAKALLEVVVVDYWELPFEI